MPQNGWAERVGVAVDQGFAYVPGEIIVAGQSGVEAVRNRHQTGFADEEDTFPSDAEPDGFTRYFRLFPPEGTAAEDKVDTLALVEDLRDDGVMAQPNHVFLAHCACGCACGPHPATTCANPVFASPVFASPVFASPVFASPVFASPVFASPVFASPVFASPVFASAVHPNGERKSSARPAPAPAALPGIEVSRTESDPPRITVLDTGFADDSLRPAALPNVIAEDARDFPDMNGDDYLDPAAGHGTFIAGVIEQLVPGCQVTVGNVLTTQGVGNEWAIAQRIRQTAGSVDLLNLSFGGYAPAQARVLASAVRYVQFRGAVVVASAGNDGTCMPTYPAALPGVVGVGAIGPTGPAPFSNYGPWVRACAPGADIVSSFFSAFEGARRPAGSEPDPDDFHEWAMWSGTSFAAPAVTAALAREMRLFGITPAQAVERVIDAVGLLRIPGLGTVVNII